MITPEEAIDILKKQKLCVEDRENELRRLGYPAYTTQVGWLGYSDERIRELCREYLAKGFDSFKIKVGQNLERDIERCGIVREEIGFENKLVTFKWVVYRENYY